MSAQPRPDLWNKALAGDKDAFESIVAPYLDELTAAAHRLLNLQAYSEAVGGTHLTPEELVGETLLRAFDKKARFEPSGMTFRAWLHGLQARALALYERSEADYASKSLLSMDEVVPTGDEIDAVEEDWWEFRQPFDVLKYEDVIAGTEPYDLDLVPATPLDDATARVLALLDLPPLAQHAVVLHDEFDVSMAETAQILRASIQETSEHLNAARASLRDRMASA